ncbi:MAG: DUF1080 domain-containing protein [Saprospiraceae bacterium]|nr:DUF1080 domain-containing protein [Saprospiraceae bacterium]
MKKIFTFAALVLASGVHAQITDPVATEVWHPVPRMVTFQGTSPVPSDAVVLFGGNNLEQWMSDKDGGKAMWDVKDGIITVKAGTGDIKTKQKFGSCQLHLEFRTPAVVEGTGQGRGNSGVFFQEKYEVQILDNYNNVTYSNGQCASVYKQHIPLVNACKGPGEWQSYDIIFNAPVFNKDGVKVASGSFTVIQNGILVQNHVEIKGTTEYIGLPKNDAHGMGSIKLQDHGNPMSFRNIWVREL